LNRLIRCVCGKKIGPDPRNFNQRVSLGRNDLLIRTFLSAVEYCGADEYLYPGLAEKKLFSCTIFANISIWEVCLLRINS
ncbi:hypothetical protein UY846_15855, partial [Escherichia coli]|nr:hypothetical protein [Escherichia coli]MDY8483448.1 hypothetical protein [Escherichia coli]MDY8524741.1 hypothetical protein [Escherichia coli]MDY8538370.1 hypothetical protein [Escherichia coli]MDY8593329.1 hypothetical protein [Escherichia coli]